MVIYLSLTKPDNFGAVVHLTKPLSNFSRMAAYYHNGRGQSGFICGGSLVSARIVVTAAHCIQYKREAEIKKPEDASFFIGKYNIESFDGEDNFVVSGVTQLVLHPEWNYLDDHFDADIAVAILVKTLTWTKFVKPICLWTYTTSYRDIVGRKAIIAGWGKTEFNALSTNRPKWASIDVVDERTCIWSNAAFTNLISDRTFCAGDLKNNVGPCSGDSGGGLMVEQNGKWYLRGIISSSFFDRIHSTCDTSSYAVFTDATQYTDWLKGIIQSFG